MSAPTKHPQPAPGTPDDGDRPWHALPIEAAYARAQSSPTGLASEEAARRLRVFGPNLLEHTSTDGPLQILWRQIDSPLIWVLIGATVLAIAVGKLTDGLVVLAVVVLNSLIGLVQEYRASRAIEALRGMVPEHACVLRAGVRVDVPVASLVPGDLVLLASGDRIPADLRLVAVKNLRVEEATLTGESVPVAKGVQPVAAEAPVAERTALGYAGTLVTYGTATGLVVATGSRTELGRISALLEQAVEMDTPLTRALATVGKSITLGVLAVSAAILAIGLARATAAGLPLAEAARETLVFAIALAVGAIPEGLPAIVTIALAIGVRRMAARRAIVRRLPAVETLGSTTVICSDKTGTLTRNEMTVVEVWTSPGGSCRVEGVGYTPVGGFWPPGAESWGPAPQDVRRLLADAALCSDATLRQDGGHWTIAGDPTEGALVVAAEKAGLAVAPLRARNLRIDTIPFESENRFMATLHEDPAGGARAILKGAPEALLRRCPADLDQARIHAEVERLAAEGMRVLAVADKPWAGGAAGLDLDQVASGLRFVGLVGMIDPPRPEGIAAVLACQAAGIVVKMITGDHLITAQAIGVELGLANAEAARAGSTLSGLDEAALGQAAEATAVFARVAPEHKLMLVRALQDQGNVVAMTGDGVNDAPALKQANVGVAMGIAGTSVAKEAADVVLTDDNFASIVAAVEEGRRVYDNLRKSLAFVLPTNLGLALILIYAVLFFPFDPATQLLLLPIKPTQILWINLVATVTLALPLAFEAKEPDLMRRPPRNPAAPILSGFVAQRTAIAAVLMTAGAVGLFQWEYVPQLAQGAAGERALAEAQTMAVTTVIWFQIFYLLQCRSLRDSVFRIGFASNPWIFVGIWAIVLLQAAFIYAPPLNALFGTAPLGVRDLFVAGIAGAVILPAIGLEKWLRRRAPRAP